MYQKLVKYDTKNSHKFYVFDFLLRDFLYSHERFEVLKNNFVWFMGFKKLILTMHLTEIADFSIQEKSFDSDKNQLICSRTDAGP